MIQAAAPIEERMELQDVMTEYCYRVDALDDIPAVLDLFTDDAVLDFSFIGLPTMDGKPAFQAFYEGVFADMSHHNHTISNFRLDAYDGDTATVRAYARGMGRSKDGGMVDVDVRYRMNFVRTSEGWKVARYEIHPAMPMPASLEEIHGHR